MPNQLWRFWSSLVFYILIWSKPVWCHNRSALGLLAERCHYQLCLILVFLKGVFNVYNNDKFVGIFENGMTTKLWREVKKIGVNQMNVTQKKITVYLKPASTYASISNDKIRLSWFVATIQNIVSKYTSLLVKIWHIMSVSNGS